VGHNGFVLGTTNGVSWSVLGSVAGGAERLRSIAHDPLTPSRLWVISNQGIFKSIDAGATWSPEQTTGNILHPQMLSALVGYAVDWESPDLNSVFKTTDGGLGWTPVTTVGGVEWVDGIHFINQNVGWVAGENELSLNLRTKRPRSRWRRALWKSRPRRCCSGSRPQMPAVTVRWLK